jgi:hypothetical protein
VVGLKVDMGKVKTGDPPSTFGEKGQERPPIFLYKDISIMRYMIYELKRNTDKDRKLLTSLIYKQ